MDNSTMITLIGTLMNITVLIIMILKLKNSGQQQASELMDEKIRSCRKIKSAQFEVLKTVVDGTSAAISEIKRTLEKIDHRDESLIKIVSAHEAEINANTRKIEKMYNNLR